MTRHVMLIGIDGLRIDDALTHLEAPALQRFAKEGALARMTMEVPTISGPGWASILTGASHQEHGIVDNSFHGHRLLDHPDFLSLAWFADRSVSTWAATSWLPLADPSGPAPVIWWREEAQRGGKHRIVVRDGETHGYPRMDDEVVAWTLMAIRDGGPRASFVYLGEVDLAGHVYGGVSPEYAAAVRSTDARLARVLNGVHERVEAHPDEEWLVALTTDHGHLDEGGHGGAEDILTRSFLATRWFRAGAVSSEPDDLPAEISPTGVTPHLLDALFRRAG
jgi:predicted AlkP superfamily pyrophosphatase or phosphodiesterase